jgi:CO dehydrogenase maturation factor
MFSWMPWGGRKGVKDKLNPSLPIQEEQAFLKNPLTFSDIPETCLADANGVKLLVVGKIRSFGEGCACMVGNISKTVLNRLQTQSNEIVLIDAEAGLEHFGRRVDASCDLILCMVDPTFESFTLVDSVQRMAESAGIEVAYVLNKVDDSVRQTMTERLDSLKLVAAIPKSDTLFIKSLNGTPLDVDFQEIQPICKFIETFETPSATFKIL